MIRRTIASLTLLACLFYLVSACTQQADGESLARQYCQSCHLFPEPSLLPKLSWKQSVLPQMGFYLGIEAEAETGWDKAPSSPLPPGTQPLAHLSRAEWDRIVAYYVAAAPDSLTHQKNAITLLDSLPGFSAQQPAHSFSSPAVSHIQIDTLHQPASLLVCDINLQAIRRYSSRLKLTDSVSFNGGAIVDLDIHPEYLYACNVGVLSPNDGRSGRIQQLTNAGGPLRLDTAALARNLARPVSVTAADLDQDGLEDLLVCEFGHHAGALSWQKNLGNGHYESRVLRAMPGAIECHIQDVNGDGRPDIWALFTQGDESIYLFLNKGLGEFEEKLILRFPPAYGSSSFSLADVNGDGKQDLLYTCGDNSDFSPILKPYHGLYIYLNAGNDQFQQAYFFPMNGCYKATARDFDADGDLDIALISFFADYRHKPEEGFVYLKQETAMQFSAFSLKLALAGRWLTMTVNDLTGDGKPDIVLGNLSIGPYNIKPAIPWSEGPAFLLLENRFPPHR